MSKKGCKLVLEVVRTPKETERLHYLKQTRAWTETMMVWKRHLVKGTVQHFLFKINKSCPYLRKGRIVAAFSWKSGFVAFSYSSPSEPVFDPDFGKFIAFRRLLKSPIGLAAPKLYWEDERVLQYVKQQAIEEARRKKVGWLQCVSSDDLVRVIPMFKTKKGGQRAEGREADRALDPGAQEHCETT